MDMTDDLNALWRHQFHITTLQTQLESYQDLRVSKFDRSKLQNQLDQTIAASNQIRLEATSTQENNSLLTRQIATIKTQIERVDQNINKVSIECNTLRCSDPERVNIEKLLRLAAEELEQAAAEQKQEEANLIKVRNQINRARSLHFLDAQKTVSEIDVARSAYEKHVAVQNTTHKRSVDASKSELTRLTTRNSELQKEYEAQLKEETQGIARLHRMEDFVEQFEQIRTLIQMGT